MYMSHGVSILEEVNKNIFCMCKNINFVFVDIGNVSNVHLCVYICMCVCVCECVCAYFFSP